MISLVDNNKTTSVPEFSVMSSPVTSMLPPSPGRLASGDAASFQTPRHWGQVQIANNETTYVPGTHWTVILEEVILGKGLKQKQLMADCLATDFRAEEHVVPCI